MSNMRSKLLRLATNLENYYDRLRYRLEYRLGRLGPIKIVPYRGYGRPDLLYLKGRVLEDKGERPASEVDSIWLNLLNMYRRLESDEVPGARILATYEGIDQEVTADEEGFFEVHIRPKQPIPQGRMWQQVQLRLLNPLSPRQRGPVEVTGEVFVPPPTARFAVISDIDDTVVQTDAAHLLRMARNVFLSNSRSRLPFPGVAAFYRALLDGTHGNDLNPLFYVSSSPWNLYDLLCDFFTLQDIPLGPVLILRDWGLTENEILPIRNKHFKQGVIQALLEFYPDLPFILIGDSGQEDPEIYQEVTARYPERILAVYIRNVSHNLKRPAAINALAEKVVKARSTLVLANDTFAIARHAVDQGLIAPQALHSIQYEKKKDEAPATPLEKLVTPPAKPEGPTVVVQEQTPRQTVQEVKGEAIQQALNTSRDAGQKPSTVIVKSEESKNEAGTGPQGPEVDQKP